MVKWMPREEGTLKINTDGAFLHEEGTGATGAVVCGSEGRLRAASARWINLIGSALLAEAEVLRDGVRLKSRQVSGNTSLWRQIPRSWLRFGGIDFGGCNGVGIGFPFLRSSSCPKIGEFCSSSLR